MQLIRHLSDEELTDVVLEGHLRDLQHTLARLPQQLRSSTEQPEWFWQRQEAAIRSRTVATRRGFWRPMTVSAGVLALAAVALTLLTGGHVSAPPAIQAQTVSDQELMIAVEQVVQTNVPDALAPATLLADEISNAQFASTSKRYTREK